MRPKQIFFTIIILQFVILTLSACCKMACEGNTIIISLQNYKRSELDTITFISYEQGSNFLRKKDSLSYTLPNVANDTARATHVHSITSDKDWIINIPSVNKEFKISNYETATARCSCGNKKYSLVKSYTVNGTKETDIFYTLTR